ncbi:uroporphyrinogen-III synthase [Comamonas faecalis]|uniref:Uroporphyrinogen-III synthase n=1 Tax=Comamonas faecalis TaxID=1387849 RepID=A0ABP7R558_9BURK
MSPVVVTRPARDAAQWVGDLQALGIDALALPLIDIHAVSTAPLQQALVQARLHAQAGRYQAIMVVSGNAATHFFTPALVAALAAQPGGGTRIWAPGPGTAGQLQALGLPPGCIDSPAADARQFDSESLWQSVGPRVGTGTRVLVVRGTSTPALEGGNGRDWLAARIAAAGGQADFVAAYERAAPAWSSADLQQLRALLASDPLWLLSSSEALSHLVAALPRHDWSACRALATHPRIAQSATGHGFGRVLQCRPTLADVAASIKSEHERR